eukprot:13179723-Alexandrium_andersonii.AAC.1
MWATCNSYTVHGHVPVTAQHLRTALHVTRRRTCCCHMLAARTCAPHACRCRMPHAATPHAAACNML